MKFAIEVDYSVYICMYMRNVQINFVSYVSAAFRVIILIKCFNECAETYCVKGFNIIRGILMPLFSFSGFNSFVEVATVEN